MDCLVLQQKIEESKSLLEKDPFGIGSKIDGFIHKDKANLRKAEIEECEAKTESLRDEWRFSQLETKTMKKAFLKIKREYMLLLNEFTMGKMVWQHKGKMRAKKYRVKKDLFEGYDSNQLNGFEYEPFDYEGFETLEIFNN